MWRSFPPKAKLTQIQLQEQKMSSEKNVKNTIRNKAYSIWSTLIKGNLIMKDLNRTLSYQGEKSTVVVAESPTNKVTYIRTEHNNLKNRKFYWACLLVNSRITMIFWPNRFSKSIKSRKAFWDMYQIRKIDNTKTTIDKTTWKMAWILVRWR